MSVEEVINIFEKQLRCVRKAEKGVCDKDCKNCEFVENPETLMDAYSIAIVKLRRIT